MAENNHFLDNSRRLKIVLTNHGSVVQLPKNPHVVMYEYVGHTDQTPISLINRLP
jgi:hypothetical protein